MSKNGKTKELWSQYGSFLILLGTLILYFIYMLIRVISHIPTNNVPAGKILDISQKLGWNEYLIGIGFLLSLGMACIEDLRGKGKNHVTWIIIFSFLIHIVVPFIVQSIMVLIIGTVVAVALGGVIISVLGSGVAAFSALFLSASGVLTPVLLALLLIGMIFSGSIVFGW